MSRFIVEPYAVQVGQVSACTWPGSAAAERIKMLTNDEKLLINSPPERYVTMTAPRYQREPSRPPVAYRGTDTVTCVIRSVLRGF